MHLLDEMYIFYTYVQRNLREGAISWWNLEGALSGISWELLPWWCLLRQMLPLTMTYSWGTMLTWEPKRCTKGMRNCSSLSVKTEDPYRLWFHKWTKSLHCTVFLIIMKDFGIGLATLCCSHQAPVTCCLCIVDFDGLWCGFHFIPWSNVASSIFKSFLLVETANEGNIHICSCWLKYVKIIPIYTHCC
jgi:hypothetical protein